MTLSSFVNSSFDGGAATPPAGQRGGKQHVSEWWSLWVSWRGLAAVVCLAVTLLLLWADSLSDDEDGMNGGEGVLGRPATLISRQQQKVLTDSVDSVWRQTEQLLKLAAEGADADDKVLQEAKRLQKDAQKLATAIRPPVPFYRTTFVNGTDYLADYNVAAALRPPQRAYGYGPRPAFRYPEDTPNSTFHKIPHAVVSYVPKAYYFPNFISRTMAEKAIALARPQMRRSEVAKYEGSSSDMVEDSRTSDGAWLNEDDFTATIKERMHAVTNLPRKQFEAIQVLRYKKGQMYSSHHDFFDPALYGKQDWNRAATFYIFLSDAHTGGEFSLPRANGQAQPPNLSRCDTGLRVKAKAGHAVLFYGMRPDWHLDPFSLHTGCPVEAGEKWSLVVWMQVKGASISPTVEEDMWE